MVVSLSVVVSLVVVAVVVVVFVGSTGEPDSQPQEETEAIKAAVSTAQKILLSFIAISFRVIFGRYTALLFCYE